MEQIKLRGDLRSPNNSYGWRNVVLVLGSIYALLFAAGIIAAHSTVPVVALAVLPFLGAQIYKITIVMHDCCHYSLFASREINLRVGTICGWFIGTEFKSFSRLHWQHHSKYGEEDDPQGHDYLHLGKSSLTTLGWHLVRPLLGYNLFKVGQFGVLGDAAAHPNVGLRAAESAKWGRWVTLVGTLAIQCSLVLAATLTFTVLWTALLFPAAAVTFALFFSQARGFAEHVAAPAAPPERHARTHLPNWFDKLFFYTLNFNYHVEHHMYPSVPSCHLPQVHADLIRTKDYETSPSVLRTIRWRLSLCRNT